MRNGEENKGIEPEILTSILELEIFQRELATYQYLQ